MILKLRSRKLLFVVGSCVAGTLCVSLPLCKPTGWLSRASTGVRARAGDEKVFHDAYYNESDHFGTNQITTEAAQRLSRPTIGVVSSCLLSTKFSNSTALQSLRNKEHYCDSHDNVNCFLQSESMDDRFSAHWNKFPLVERALQTNDFAVWIDCDAIFINVSATFEETGIFSEKKDVIFTLDHNGINTGVFVVRKTDWALEFLSLMYQQRASVDYFNSIGKGIGFVDQTAVKILREKYFTSEDFETRASLSPKYTGALNNYCTTGALIHHRVNCNTQECDAYLMCVMNQVQSGASVNLEETCTVPQHLQYLCTTQRKCCQVPERGPQRQNTELAKTTLVLMSFSPARIKNLDMLFREYGSMSDVLDGIVFVWNNPAVPPPEIPRGKVKIVTWLAEENSLINRYRIDSYVNTTSVLTVDDDVMLGPALIRKMVEQHVAFPTQLIGTDLRGYSLDGKYVYHPPKEQSGRLLVIGKTMLWNKMYAREYVSDEELVTFTHAHSCDDIGMNFLIRNRTKLEPIVVQTTSQLWRKDLDEADGLSVVVSQGEWTRKRHDCVAFMLNHFHML